MRLKPHVHVVGVMETSFRRQVYMETITFHLARLLLRVSCSLLNVLVVCICSSEVCERVR